jgi:hypothetical protein
MRRLLVAQLCALACTACSGHVVIGDDAAGDTRGPETPIAVDPSDPDGPAGGTGTHLVDASLVVITSWTDDDVKLTTVKLEGGKLGVSSGPGTTVVNCFNDELELVRTTILNPGCENWTGEPDVLRVPSAYGTIQQAIDAASYGDVVYVEPGQYPTSVTLRSGVRLVGSGAWQTRLTLVPNAKHIVDFSGARDVVIRGFMFEGVLATASTCATSDPFECAGDHYTAAVYADGDVQECAPPAALITQNIFADNEIGVLLYNGSRAMIRNNLFVANTSAIVANHHQGDALVMGNTFDDNNLAIGLQASFTHVVDNIIANADIGLMKLNAQTGTAGCNLIDQAPILDGPIVVGVDGNFNAVPSFLDPVIGDYQLAQTSAAIDAGCLGWDADDTKADIGAFGGKLGGWHDVAISF